MNQTIAFRKWGNSLGLRLPSALARAMHLAEGGEAELIVEEGVILIRPLKPKGRPRRIRRPMSFYEARAKAMGLSALVDPVEAFSDDRRGGEMP